MNCPKCDCGAYVFRPLEYTPAAVEITCQECGATLGIANDLEEIHKKLDELDKKMGNIEKIFKETLRNKGLF